MCIDKGIESEMIGCMKAVDIMNRRSIQVEIRLLITEAVLTHDDHPITGDYISSVMSLNKQRLVSIPSQMTFPIVLHQMKTMNLQ